MAENEVKPLTIDDVNKCPKCGIEGRQHIKQRAANGDGMTYTFICMQKLCPWYDTGWTVQVKHNGEIPQRDLGNRNKQFQPLTAGQAGMAARIIEDAKRANGID